MVAIAFPPITPTLIGEALVRTVNGRDLHAFLQAGRVFGAWIKGRITKYGFVENVDYVTVHVLRFPDRESSSFDLDDEEPASSNEEAESAHGGARPQRVIDYFLTIDMAKELSMVENNEQGRLARRYFIDCERRAKEAEAMAYAPREEVPSVNPHPEVRIADSRLQMVAECRRIFGAPAARSLWRELGFSDFPEPPERVRPGRPRAKVNLAERAERLIRDAPDHCMSRADLYRRMDHGVRFVELDRITNELVASGRVVIFDVPQGDRIGRPPIIYQWVSHRPSD